jgi:hypothetical protein
MEFIIKTKLTLIAVALLVLQAVTMEKCVSVMTTARAFIATEISVVSILYYIMD